MHFLSSKQLANSIAARDVSSESLVKNFYDRIDRYNPKLNAIVIDIREQALQSAIARDEQNTQGNKMGPLHGVPVTVKECFNMEGLKTTVNFPPIKNNIAKSNSILVQRLQDAGAIILGKTNVPLLLSDSQTFGPLYPTANNPYDITRVPGGSTGGGAAAVASGLTTFEIGSDIGGSIRNPAHYCGLFGLKPTQNGHLQDGHVPPLPGRKTGFLAMNSTGPLARTMDDIKLAYDVCYQPRWDYLKYLPIERPQFSGDDVSQLNIAYFDQISGVSCNSDVQLGLEKVCETLRSKGATVKKIDFDEQLIHRIFQVWARLFGFVVGQDFNWPIRQMLKLKFNKDVRGSKLNLSRELNQGLNMNFKVFSAALREQQEVIAEVSRYFDQYDFILGPTSVGAAFEHNHGHKPITTEGQSLHYSDYCFAFVMPFNAMGNPVLAIPSGLNKQGLPIGISVIAPHHCEQGLMNFGTVLEQAGFKFVAPEGY